MTKGTLPDIRRTVGMVFQDPDDQLFLPTVAEDVAFGPLNLGLSATDVAARVAAALARVGGEHLAERPPYRLSGGEKRSVAIATVLAMEPNILVMDEPSAGLDPRARRRLMGLLQGFEHTRIIATHDLDLAAQLCERTIVMGGGRVLADRPTAEVFSDDELLAAGHLERPLGMLSCPVCGAATRGRRIRAVRRRGSASHVAVPAGPREVAPQRPRLAEAPQQPRPPRGAPVARAGEEPAPARGRGLAHLPRQPRHLRVAGERARRRRTAARAAADARR